MNGILDDAEEQQRILKLLEDNKDKANKLISQLAQQISLESSSAKLLLQSIAKVLASFRKGVRELELWTEEAGTDDPSSFTSLQQQQQVYADLQQTNRKANAQVQQNAVQHVREQRKALLGSPDPSAKQKQLQDSNQLLGASKEITQGLRRTKQLLAQELDHTSTTLAAMDASHERLAKGKEEYEKQTPLLTRSRRLLSRMSWHSVLDALTLYGSLAIFFLVVAYILQKRLLYFVPNFLIPSFSSSPTPGSPAALTPNSVSRTGLAAQAGGPPSNDRWYEAQPGYGAGNGLHDDQWYEAQRDDTMTPGAASELDLAFEQQQQQQQQNAALQHKRQLEEVYREVAAQQPDAAPEPQAFSQPISGFFRESHERLQQQPHADVQDHVQGTASEDASDIFEHIPGHTSISKPAEVKHGSHGSKQASQAPAAATPAELEIRHSLQEPSIAEPLSQSPYEASSDSASSLPPAQEPIADVGRDESILPGQTTGSQDTAELLQQQQQQQPPPNAERSEGPDSTGGDDAEDGLNTYPGLEKVSIPDAVQATAPSVEEPITNMTGLADDYMRTDDGLLEHPAEMPLNSSITSASGQSVDTEEPGTPMQAHEAWLSRATLSSDEDGDDDHAAAEDSHAGLNLSSVHQAATSNGSEAASSDSLSGTSPEAAKAASVMSGKYVTTADAESEDSQIRDAASSNSSLLKEVEQPADGSDEDTTAVAAPVQPEKGGFPAAFRAEHDILQMDSNSSRTDIEQISEPQDNDSRDEAEGMAFEAPTSGKALHDVHMIPAGEAVTLSASVNLTNADDESAPAYELNLGNKTYDAEDWTLNRSTHRSVATKVIPTSISIESDVLIDAVVSETPASHKNLEGDDLAELAGMSHEEKASAANDSLADAYESDEQRIPAWRGLPDDIDLKDLDTLQPAGSSELNSANLAAGSDSNEMAFVDNTGTGPESELVLTADLEDQALDSQSSTDEIDVGQMPSNITLQTADQGVQAKPPSVASSLQGLWSSVKQSNPFQRPSTLRNRSSETQPSHAGPKLTAAADEPGDQVVDEWADHDEL